jgi:hypothetical protein
VLRAALKAHDLNGARPSPTRWIATRVSIIIIIIIVITILVLVLLILILILAVPFVVGSSAWVTVASVRLPERFVRLVFTRRSDFVAAAECGHTGAVRAVGAIDST